MPLNLKWCTCGDDKHWCNLENLNLPIKSAPVGICIIWYEGDPGRVVRIGQGKISDRISKHKTDPAITRYSKNGTLRVTWATVPAPQRDGVERYLA